MKHVLATTLIILAASTVACGPAVNTVEVIPTGGDAVAVDGGEPQPGYTLFAPLRSRDTYLVDLDGKVVHMWADQQERSGPNYLLENGDLLTGKADPDNPNFSGGGIGESVRRYDWEGNLVWDFKYANEDHCLHHDIEQLPNGNILMIAWEKKTAEEAIAAGRDPSLIEDDEVWPDHVIEVEPEGATGGKIVWEWHLWDHLIQDHDSEQGNFGVVADHPELVDVNYVGATRRESAAEMQQLRSIGYVGGGEDEEEDDEDEDDRRDHGRADWIHTNAIAYNADLDQIALSALRFSEIWVIDHSTTTEEAAGHTGGRSGKGGDLVYRWGNPAAYRTGTAEDRQLFSQHNVRWTEPGHPGAGNFTAFNNGRGRPDGDYSSIVEIVPPVDASGNYELVPGEAYGPAAPVWSYTGDPKTDFFSGHISGAHRLKNGNTLICSGVKGRVFEVSAAGAIVWEYYNPYGGEVEEGGRPRNDDEEDEPDDDDSDDGDSVDGDSDDSDSDDGDSNDGDDDSDGDDGDDDNGGDDEDLTSLYRAMRIPLDHPGLAGRVLEPLDPQPVPFSSLTADDDPADDDPTDDPADDPADDEDND